MFADIMIRTVMVCLMLISLGFTAWATADMFHLFMVKIIADGIRKGREQVEKEKKNV